MANKSMLVDYVAPIIQLLGRMMQLQIKQEDGKRGKSCLQKCRDMNLDLRGLDENSGSGKSLWIPILSGTPDLQTIGGRKLNQSPFRLSCESSNPVNPDSDNYQGCLSRRKAFSQRNV